MNALNAPDLTVITPVLNGAAHIDACLDSTALLARAGLRVEHIVVDGGSTDATLALLAARPELRVLSNPGEGAHGACNLAVSVARGGAIAFLMADDTWTEAAGDAFAEALAAPAWDLAVFPAELHDGDEVRTLFTPKSLWDVLRRYPGLNSALLAAPLAKRISLSAAFPGVHDRLFMIEAWAVANTLWRGEEVVARMNVHVGSRTMSPLRDVAALKAELNRLAAALSVGAHTGVAKTVFALWYLHTALSLVAEGALAWRQGRERVGSITRPKPMTPNGLGWVLALQGLLAVTFGADALFESKRTRLCRCVRIGLAEAGTIGGGASVC